MPTIVIKLQTKITNKIVEDIILSSLKETLDESQICLGDIFEILGGEERKEIDLYEIDKVRPVELILNFNDALGRRSFIFNIQIIKVNKNEILDGKCILYWRNNFSTYDIYTKKQLENNMDKILQKIQNDINEL